MVKGELIGCFEYIHGEGEATNDCFYFFIVWPWFYKVELILFAIQVVAWVTVGSTVTMLHSKWQVVWCMQEPCSHAHVGSASVLVGDIDDALDSEKGNVLHIINWLEYYLSFWPCSYRNITALYLQVA